jgi:glycosyltransferase involved in cell wall biosynthesis
LSELQECGVETVLYSDRPIHPAHVARFRPGRYSIRVSAAMKYFWWEQNWLPRQSKADGIDVLHSPFHFGLPFLSHCPRVLTLHDAIDAIYYRASFWGRPGHMLNALSQWVARARASHFITVSKHSKQDLVLAHGIAPDRISVIYEAADRNFNRAVTPSQRSRIRAHYHLSNPYFFYVGGFEARKNLPFLVQAFAVAKLDNVDLVLAGGDTGILREEVERSGAGASIRLLGHVPDEDLPALYGEALALVYPSAYEGFGLQLCEAMRVGCPVLAARATSLPEILADGGETFALDSPSELVALMRRVAQSESLRQEMAERARTRAHHFDWRRTARETLEVYRRLGLS